MWKTTSTSPAEICGAQSQCLRPSSPLSLQVPQSYKHKHTTPMDEYLHWAHHGCLHVQGNLQDLSQNAKLSYLGFTKWLQNDFLPWLHHSVWCRQNTISEARVKFLKKSTVTATTTQQIKTANFLFTHCFKAANSKLLPCGLRSDEVHWVQISRIRQHCSQDNSYFLVLFDPTLDRPVLWLSTCIEMVRKSHIREPGYYWM